MIEFSLLFIGVAFVSGVITFFAPCTLPLVPAFLGVIAGVGQQDLEDPEKIEQMRWKIFINAVFYVLGFSTIFILFGIAFSLLGTISSIQVWIQRIGGVLIILFGLFIVGALKVSWLNTQKQFHSVKLFKTASMINSFGIGALFALGWSPCVGPILGGILLLASTSGSILQGTILLISFAAGLGLPFLLTSLLVGKAMKVFSRMGKVLTIINAIAGAFLIILGTLLLLGQSDAFFGWMQVNFGELEFLQDFLLEFDGGLQ